METTKTRAPWPPSQVARLWEFQTNGKMHPFTCLNRGDGQHATIGTDLGMLIPTIKGWVCPFCNYTQTWAHDFMAEKQEPTPPPKGE